MPSSATAHDAPHPATGFDAASAPAVEVRGLSKTFHKNAVAVEVLKSIDLTLDKGATLAIMGASGAGKSTLLHVLGGLEKPSAGTVEVGGEDLYGLNELKRAALRNRAIGFVFQFHHLLPEFSALENVMMPALISREPRGEAEARARALLEEVALGHRLTHRPGELSGGEQQRVSLARALIMDPAVVLADEPTGNLDGATGDRVFDLLLGMNRRRGTTLVMVTHNPDLAARMERRSRMQDGVLVDGVLERGPSA